jgi:hypothetical protein
MRSDIFVLPPVEALEVQWTLLLLRRQEGLVDQLLQIAVIVWWPLSHRQNIDSARSFRDRVDNPPLIEPQASDLRLNSRYLKLSALRWSRVTR